MNFKRNLLFISIILCILISLSAVSANENAADLVSDDSGSADDLSLESTSEDYDLSSSSDDVPILDSALTEDSNENVLQDVEIDNDGLAKGDDNPADDILLENSEGDTVHTSLTVYPKNVYKDQKFTIEVYVNGLKESVGYVEIYKEGQYFATENVSAGVATFTFRATTLGKTTYYAYYSGGNSSSGTSYSSSNSSESTVMIKAKAEISVTGYSSYYNSGKKFTVKVKNTVTGVGDRYAKIRIIIYRNNKKVYAQTATTNSKGVYKGTIKQGAGNYKMVVKMASDHYTYKKASASVKVFKSRVKIRAYRYFGNEGQKALLSAKVKDKNGKPVKIGTVRFTVRGKTYKAKVKNGTASKYLTLPVGTYKYAAAYVNKNYYTKKDSSNVTVKAIFDTKLIASNKVINAPKYRVYKLTLKSKAGKAIKGTQLTLKIGKNTFKAKTNKKGVATFKIRYSKIKKAERSKTYKVTARVIKNKNVKTLKNNKISLKVDGKTYNLKTSAKGYAVFKAKKPVAVRKYYVFLRGFANKPIPKASITLKVNKKAFKATTNAKGRALFKINNLNKNAKFKTSITFAGKNKYRKSTKTTYIIIKDR